MKKQKKGRVVNFTSGRALQGSKHGAHYAASKGGVKLFMQSLAQELAVPVLPDLRFPGELPTRTQDPTLTPSSFRELRSRLMQSFEECCPQVGTFQARADVALAAERYVGERVLAYAHELIPQVDTLVYSGGVALNCTLNAELAKDCRSLGRFELRLHVKDAREPHGGREADRLGRAACRSLPLRPQNRRIGTLSYS